MDTSISPAIMSIIPDGLLSQATVSRIMQLGFLIYEVTKFSTIEIAPSFPPRLLLTLAINPKRVSLGESKTKDK